MTEEQGQGENRREFRITPKTGQFNVTGEGIATHVHGPTRDVLTATDTHGWTAAADIESGIMSSASATGIPSQNEHLTIETCRMFVRRLNLDGATWDDPVELDQRSGVDAEARDTQDSTRRLRIQVTRAEVDGDFWGRLHHESQADLPPGTVAEAALRIWAAIWNKRHHAHPDVVLVLNAIRTPWLALPSIVDAFRQQHGQDARRVGFESVWIVGWSEAFTKKLDQ
jgi:hypothetical protein